MSSVLPAFDDLPLNSQAPVSAPEPDLEIPPFIEGEALAVESPARALQQRLAQSLAEVDDRRWSPRAKVLFFVAVNGVAWVLIGSAVKVLLLH